MTVRCENQSASLWAKPGARGGYRPDYQRMPRVDIVVVKSCIGICTPCFSQCASEEFPLEQAEVERGGEHEHFAGARKLVPRRGCQGHIRSEAQNVRRFSGDLGGLRFGLGPRRIARL